MLFNSYAYLLVFLPLALTAFHGLRRLGGKRAALACAVAASLVFYGWWNAVYLLLLLPLLLATYALARRIAPREGQHPPGAKACLVLGLILNLGALAWFKYANFFSDNLDAAFGLGLQFAPIALPLGISFFVFQKVAFLVDAWRGRIDRFNFLDYSLFVTFFPQLIAGPIVHHSEVLPQFRRADPVSAATFAMGLTILAIGLAKKVLLADHLAPFASARFDAAAAGGALDGLDAWAGALAYSGQLYFDFSGYSDMAIGGALLFGIRLPVNFASPYQAASIIDFWRRWHITLSRFLRDYLYISLGGNRQGPGRRHLNLFLTMLLGGLWHGAGWTFVAWGALHGAYLGINHAWRAWAARTGCRFERLPGGSAFAGFLTLAAVVVGWVLFRAADLPTAGHLLAAMAGFGPVNAPAMADTGTALAWALALLALARFAPNSQDLVGYTGPGTAPAAPAAFRWRPTAAWAVGVGTTAGVALLSLSRVSEFLYFRF